MLTVTLPDPLADRVREKAEEQHRTPEQVVADCVARVLPEARKVDREQLLAELGALHDELAEQGVWITDDVVDMIRRDRDGGRL